MMVSFDCLNACCSVSSQWNLLLGLSSSRKGSIVLAMLNAYNTWFTKPNQDLTSVRLCGVGKSEMAMMAWSHSVIGDFEVCKFNFVLNKSELLWIGPCLPQVSSQFNAWKKLSFIVSDHRRVSSMHLVLFGMDEVISSYIVVYPSPEAM